MSADNISVIKTKGCRFAVIEKFRVCIITLCDPPKADAFSFKWKGMEGGVSRTTEQKLSRVSERTGGLL